MAKKFKIAQNPTFKKEISIPRIGGDPIVVEFEFKYLPRPQLAAIYDKWQKETNKLIESEIKDYLELTQAEVDLQVSQLKDILVGWNFDDEFNDENISALVETCVHAATVITEKYGEAYSNAKLGN